MPDEYGDMKPSNALRSVCLALSKIKWIGYLSLAGLIIKFLNGPSVHDHQLSDEARWSQISEFLVPTVIFSLPIIGLGHFLEWLAIKPSKRLRREANSPRDPVDASSNVSHECVDNANSLNEVVSGWVVGAYFKSLSINPVNANLLAVSNTAVFHIFTKSITDIDPVLSTISRSENDNDIAEAIAGINNVARTEDAHLHVERIPRDALDSVELHTYEELTRVKINYNVDGKARAVNYFIGIETTTDEEREQARYLFLRLRDNFRPGAKAEDRQLGKSKILVEHVFGLLTWTIVAMVFAVFVQGGVYEMFPVAGPILPGAAAIICLLGFFVFVLRPILRRLIERLKAPPHYEVIQLGATER